MATEECCRRKRHDWRARGGFNPEGPLADCAPRVRGEGGRSRCAGGCGSAGRRSAPQLARARLAAPGVDEHNHVGTADGLLPLLSCSRGGAQEDVEQLRLFGWPAQVHLYGGEGLSRTPQHLHRRCRRRPRGDVATTLTLEDGAQGASPSRPIGI
mgnify:CR=1 FL=1